MRVIVRPARRAEAVTIADLHAASWRTAYAPIVRSRALGPDLNGERRRHWRTTLARTHPRDIVLIAEAKGEALGFIAVWLDGARAFVDNLHVRPDLRGQRLGERLMRKAARRARARGAKQMHLWTFTANGPAVRFYRGLGAVSDRREFSHSRLSPAPCQRLVWCRLDRLAALA